MLVIKFQLLVYFPLFSSSEFCKLNSSHGIEILQGKWRNFHALKKLMTLGNHYLNNFGGFTVIFTVVFKYINVRVT